MFFSIIKITWSYFMTGLTWSFVQNYWFTIHWTAWDFKFSQIQPKRYFGINFDDKESKKKKNASKHSLCKILSNIKKKSLHSIQTNHFQTIMKYFCGCNICLQQNHHCPVWILQSKGCFKYSLIYLQRESNIFGFNASGHCLEGARLLNCMRMQNLA